MAARRWPRPLVETERRVDQLADEVAALRRSREKIFRPPPIEWIKDRLNSLHQVLEQRTARSAQTLRNPLGPIRLELITPDIGRPFYRAVTTVDALALIEEPPPAGAEGGSNSLQRWDSFQIPDDGDSGSSGGAFVQLPGPLCTSRCKARGAKSSRCSSREHRPFATTRRLVRRHLREKRPCRRRSPIRRGCAAMSVVAVPKERSRCDRASPPPTQQRRPGAMRAWMPASRRGVTQPEATLAARTRPARCCSRRFPTSRTRPSTPTISTIHQSSESTGITSGSSGGAGSPRSRDGEAAGARPRDAGCQTCVLLADRTTPG